MELVVLFVVLALLLFGPRRGGGWPGPVAMFAGALFLLWFILALAFGWTWKSIFGEFPQP